VNIGGRGGHRGCGRGVVIGVGGAGACGGSGGSSGGGGGCTGVGAGGGGGGVVCIAAAGSIFLPFFHPVQPVPNPPPLAIYGRVGRNLDVATVEILADVSGGASHPLSVLPLEVSFFTPPLEGVIGDGNLMGESRRR
jgi:hypothetical protein